MSTEAELQKIKKEQQQKLILAVIMIVGALGGFWTLVMSPIKEKIASVNTKLQAEKEIERKNARLIKGQKKIEKDWHENGLKLYEYINDRMPPVENELAWLERRIRELSTAAGVENMVVRNKNRKGLPISTLLKKKKKMGKKDIVSFWLRYEAELNFSCTYNQLGCFLESLENRFPFAEIKDLVITKNVRRNNEKPTRILNVSMIIYLLRFNENITPLDRIPTKEILDNGVSKLVITAPKKKKDK